MEKVSMKLLKEFAQRLPIDSPLRVLILAEPDSLPVEEFLYKSQVWQKSVVMG
jgi:hypothetical protein